MLGPSPAASEDRNFAVIRYTPLVIGSALAVRGE
jgi:hypothetical protein